MQLKQNDMGHHEYIYTQSVQQIYSYYFVRISQMVFPAYLGDIKCNLKLPKKNNRFSSAMLGISKIMPSTKLIKIEI